MASQQLRFNHLVSILLLIKICDICIEIYLINFTKPLASVEHYENTQGCPTLAICTLIARFMGPTWGPSGSIRTKMGPMLAPWTLLSGYLVPEPKVLVWGHLHNWDVWPLNFIMQHCLHIAYSIDHYFFIVLRYVISYYIQLQPIMTGLNFDKEHNCW